MTRRTFSESFKRDKVRLYETGKMSVAKMASFYSVSETALYKWIDQYRSVPATERVVFETESDYLQLVELQDRIVKMERLIGNQQLTIDYMQSVIASAKEHYGEDIEKKFG